MERPRLRVPAFVLVLLGWLTAQGAVERLEVRRAQALAQAAVPAGGVAAAAWPTVAQVRGIEGFGPQLAHAVVAHLWRHAGAPGGGWHSLDTVPGIGPTRLERLREATFWPESCDDAPVGAPLPHRAREGPLSSGSRIPGPEPPEPDLEPMSLHLPVRPQLDAHALERATVAVLRAAFAEDLGLDAAAALGATPEALIACDVTTRTAVPAEARARGTLLVKGHGVVAGLDVFERAVRTLDPAVVFERLRPDGTAVAPGDVVARIEGRARALLVAERTALNLLQRLSGVASITARCVALAAGRARILDTRKTTPGLRLLEKAAVAAGGGENHRVGLYDEAMVKDNHVELAGRGIEDVLAALRTDLGPDVRITCEARDAAEAHAAVRGGADVVLLDNMTVATMGVLAPELRALAATLGRSIELEASGGVNEHTLPEIAACGVDRISIGALTHSAPALDISLELSALPSGGPWA
jgi:nicotinate-nucleotide pyrophosphorylase (carboxylating)